MTASSRKLTRNQLLAAVVVVAAGLGAALIAVSATGSKSHAPAATSVYGAAEASRLLAGIPQQDNVLGSPKAPVALAEYADIQCPFCAAWTLDTFPNLVRKYVSRGQVKRVFHGVTFIGPDSETGLRAVLAAGSQNRLWNVLDLLYTGTRGRREAAG